MSTHPDLQKRVRCAKRPIIVKMRNRHAQGPTQKRMQMAVLLDLFLPRPAWSHSTAELLDFESERMSVPTLEKIRLFFGNRHA